MKQFRKNTKRVICKKNNRLDLKYALNKGKVLESYPDGTPKKVANGIWTTVWVGC